MRKITSVELEEEEVRAILISTQEVQIERQKMTGADNAFPEMIAYIESCLQQAYAMGFKDGKESGK